MNQGFAGVTVAYLLVVYETSTIFLALRMMLRGVGLKDHPLCWIFETIFIMWFVVSRIGWGTFCIAFIVFEDGGVCSIQLKCFLCIFQTLNYFWLYAIAKMRLFKPEGKQS